jgi:hypothetical protein
MKKLLSVLTLSVFLMSCHPDHDDCNNTIPVDFTFSAPECEKVEILFTGESFGDVHTITSNAGMNLRTDQKYTVNFKLKADRCSSGAIVLSGDSANGLFLSLLGFPSASVQQHVTPEAHYYVVVQGE